MSFRNFIENTISKEKRNNIKWDYYNAYDYDNSIDIQRIYNNPKAFIKNYFANGSKNLALNILQAENEDKLMNMPYFSNYRALHTVSTFFLGLLIENAANPDNPLEINCERDYTNMPFSYLWFLTCLYHDYGYCVEGNKDIFPLPLEGAPIPSCENPRRYNFFECRQLGYIKRKLKIQCSPYSCFGRKFSTQARHIDDTENEITMDDLLFKLTKYNLRKGVKFNNGIEIKRNTYTSTLITKYFNYCLNELEPKCYNHGIVGGFLLYDRLLKNYVKAFQENESRYQRPYQDENFHHFYYDDQGKYRQFFIEQIPIFSYISDCIISHNIWKAKPIDVDKYIEYGLDKLLSENFEKISIKKNPMLYILSVADVLEPCKLFKGIFPNSPEADLWKAWDCFDFKFIEKSKIELSVLEPAKFEKVYEQVKELETWVEIKFEKIGEQKLEIEFE